MQIKGTIQLTPHDLCLIEQAKQYIENNYRKRITAQTVSEELDIRLPELQKGIKQLTGHTLHSYQNAVRLEEAKRKLVNNPELTIKQIATCVGYKQTSHFAQLFKDAFGLTPLKYRLVAFGLNEIT